MGKNNTQGAHNSPPSIQYNNQPKSTLLPKDMALDPSSHYTMIHLIPNKDSKQNSPTNITSRQASKTENIQSKYYQY